jgi:hypothetical protein
MSALPALTLPNLHIALLPAKRPPKHLGCGTWLQLLSILWLHRNGALPPGKPHHLEVPMHSKRSIQQSIGGFRICAFSLQQVRGAVYQAKKVMVNFK